MGDRLHGRWVERPWGRQRVWEAGRGTPLLAVHGLGGSGRYWQGLADRVGDRYLVVAPDLAGFGSSDKPDIAYDRAGHLDDLTTAAPFDGPVAVVGHSLGGVLAALWASGNASRVEALALAAPPFPLGEGPDYRLMGTPPSSIRRRAAVGIAKVALPVVSYPIGIARRYPPAVVRDFTRQTLGARGGTMWSLLTDPTIREDVDDAGVIDGRIPTLIVHVVDDRTVRIEAHDRWASLLPRADARMLDGGGHQFLLRSGFEPVASWLAGQASRPAGPAGPPSGSGAS
jgi:pimeloyl-ACP methyl ester carboxylesterase